MHLVLGADFSLSANVQDESTASIMKDSSTLSNTKSVLVVQSIIIIPNLKPSRQGDGNVSHPRIREEERERRQLGEYGSTPTSLLCTALLSRTRSYEEWKMEPDDGMMG